ncbi:MAG: DUF2934 domain-containing protein [Verrucomicrobiae bacterium]|nr:DUF2934 domain-containing protein [Verrucomicrobiae bacterium]
MKKQPHKRSTTVKPKPHEPTHEEIAARAYQIYLERGCQPGHELDDWLQAEYELRQLPVRELAKLKSPSAKNSQPGGRSVVDVVRSALR